MYPHQLDDSTWPTPLLRAPRGKPLGCIANIFAVVENVPEFRGLVVYDRETDRFNITRSPPGVERKDDFPRSLRSDDITWMTVWLQRHNINARSGTVRQVIHIISRGEEARSRHQTAQFK